MRNLSSRADHLTRQIKLLEKQVADLKKEIKASAKTDIPSWPKGRLSKKRAHKAIQLLLKESGGSMAFEDLFQKLREGGWFPTTCKGFYEKSPEDQEAIARRSFSGSLTLQVESGSLASKSGILSLT